MRYEDFDIMIVRSGTGYKAHVVTSPAGEAVTDFKLPFSEIEIENFLLKIGRPRRRVRATGSPEIKAIKDFGKQLYTAVFSGEVQACLSSSLGNLCQSPDCGLRIRLRLSKVPELAGLPWEYLYNPSLNRFLSLSKNTPVVRHLSLPEQIRPCLVKLPIHVLVIISSPAGYPALNVQKEWTKLKEATSDLAESGYLLLERMKNPTIGNLSTHLRRHTCNILHFIGHGGFHRHLGEGVLIFEDDNGSANEVTGERLGTILLDHESLRLAVLNACEGARADDGNPFAGVAQNLIQQRVPAVVAMQFEVTDQAAITFSHSFYRSIAEGESVDAAVAEGRKDVYSKSNDVEWGIPALYLRSSDGKIFDVPPKDQQRAIASGGIRGKQPRRIRLQKHRGIIVSIVAAVVLVVILGFWLRTSKSWQVPPIVEKTLSADMSFKGIKIQDASLTVQDASLGDFRGQFVLLHAWAPWCAPCRVEVPSLVDFLNEYSLELEASGLKFLLVAIDSEEEKIREWIREFGILLPVYSDTEGHLKRQLGIAGMPYSVILDRDGKIIDCWPKTDWQKDGPSLLEVVRTELVTEG